jgi:hypothetical protein
MSPQAKQSDLKERLTLPSSFDHSKACQFPAGMHLLDIAYMISPIPLYQWQRDVLCAAAEPHSRVICSTPNESGKTSVLIPIFLLGIMMAFPGAMCYTTSGSEQQVKEQLFVNQLAPVIARFPGWTISTASMTVTAPNGSRLVGYRCVDPGKVEGFHGYMDYDQNGKPRYRPCAYALDESKTIEDPIHNAVRRIDPDFMLSVSTPGASKGWFYSGIDPDDLDQRGLVGH